VSLVVVALRLPCEGAAQSTVEFRCTLLPPYAICATPATLFSGMEKRLDGQCIGILKVAEDEDSADYIFCCDVWVPDENKKGRFRQHQTNFGRVRIIKASGEVELIYPMPDDVGERRASATAFKLNQHWRQGNFPKATMWASG
jgi:hypothetical protein